MELQVTSWTVRVQTKEDACKISHAYDIAVHLLFILCWLRAHDLAKTECMLDVFYH